MATLSHALVLAAGLGTRLRPLTTIRAKPAIPVAGEPMIRRILRWLVEGGAADITINLHHLPHTITSVVGDGSDLGARVRYSWEQPAVLGTAGGPRQALDIVGGDTFVLVNGDTMTDVHLPSIGQAHAASDALVTLALTPNLEPDRYGGVLLDSDGSVSGFVARGPEAAGSHHFLGVQVVSREAFADVAAGRPADSIRGSYDRLIATRRGSVRGHVIRAQFWDVGTIADYWRTTHAWTPAGATPGGADVRIAPSATVRDSVLWDRVTVEEHALVDECILTDGVRVPAGAHYRRTILFRTPEGQMTAPLEVD